jgi:hypothetical protein
MSGRRIDDHSAWMGKGGGDCVMPKGVHTKSESSTEGAGEVGSRYPDTTEAIKGIQGQGVSKLKSHKMKEGYRY